MEHLSKWHEFAKRHEKQIKEAIVKRFSLSADKLEPLFNHEDGVFLSESNPSVLCCLIVSMENKCLYLVTIDLCEDEAYCDYTARVVG